MLKKNVVLTFILSLGLCYLPIKVDALEIVVDNGMVTFYQDNILGDDDNSGDEKDSVDEVKDEREKMTSRQRQLIRVKSAGEKTEIELRPTPSRQSTNPIPEIKEKLERIEQMESERVSLEFESRERQGEDEKTVNPVMVRTRNENSEQGLEIESRDVTAKIRQGAEFELNSETNEVTLITPSGETHTLNHLPDQAIDRMQEAGLFVDSSPVGELVSVSVNDETNNIEYRQKIKQTKKFLGLFNRQVESEIVLNDSTSEVYEEPVATGFQLLLDQLSF